MSCPVCRASADDDGDTICPRCHENGWREEYDGKGSVFVNDGPDADTWQSFTRRRTSAGERVRRAARV